MKIVSDDLWLCSDCTIGAVNGDFTGMSDATEAKVKAGLAKLGPHLVSDWNSETGEGIQEFSWHGCDCCKSRQGDELHRFAVLG